MAARVVEVPRFGPPEVLTVTSAPGPAAGPGEAVISVRAADVQLIDTTIRSGKATQWFPIRPPYVPGNGVAGRVTAVGDGVDARWAGRPVIAHTGGDGGCGGYAEQAVVPAGRLVPVPDGLGLHDAVTALHDGATALALAARTGFPSGAAGSPGSPRPSGGWVLVVGAAGGAALFLIQLAHAAGALVAGAARGPAKLDLVRKAGADLAVDYSGPGWREEIIEATGGTGPEVVFDGVGGRLGLDAFGITAEGGRFSAHGAASGGFAAIAPAEAEDRGITVRGIEQVRFGPGEHGHFAGLALAEMRAGRIAPVIGQTFPLERAADAHTALEARSAAGKTLLTVP
jgi:NADPH:quinone reductase